MPDEEVYFSGVKLADMPTYDLVKAYVRLIKSPHQVDPQHLAGMALEMAKRGVADAVEAALNWDSSN